MNIEDLLRLVSQGGSPTSADSALAPRGPAAPAPQPLPQPQPVPQPRPAPIPLDASGMGSPGILERIGAQAPNNGIAALIDMASTIARGGHSGYADARQRAALNTLSDTLTDTHEKRRLAAEAVTREQQNREATLDELKRAHDAAIRKDRIDKMTAALTAEVATAKSLQDQRNVATPEEAVGIQQRATASLARIKKLQDAIARVQAGMEPLAGTDPTTLDYGTTAARPAVTPPKSIASTTGGVVVSPEAHTIALGIKEGRTRPQYLKVLSARSGLRDQVLSDLSSMGVDVSELERQAEAEQRFTSTINGRQFTMLRGSEETIKQALKDLWDANEKVAQLTPFGSSEKVNKLADLYTANIPGPGYDAVNDRTAIASGVRDQIANVLQAGGTPTETALEIANNIVPDDRSAPPQRVRTLIKRTLQQFGIRGDVFESLSPKTSAKAPATPRPDPALPPGANPDFDPAANGGVRVVPVKAHERKAGKR